MTWEIFSNTGKWEIGSGKQILWLACPKGKLEFKFLSSPVNTDDNVTKIILDSDIEYWKMPNIGKYKTYIGPPLVG